MRRFSVVLAIALLSTGGLFLLASGPASASSHTWTSDTDFAGGTPLQTEVVGTGPAASIQLQTNPQFNWINMTPTVGPIPRTGPSMTFDETNGVVLMFGGVSNAGTYLNDLWTYNTVTNTWTNVTPGTSPPARWKAGFAFDPIVQAAFLQGGFDGNPRIDLWKYDVVAGTWTSLSPTPPRPRGMDSTPMVYDSSVQMHVMAGTDATNGTFVTWLYNSVTNKWTYRAPAPSPEPRSGHTLTFDRTIFRTILFGGAQGLTLYGDWWEYNATANTWAKLGDFTPNVTPNRRTSHAMTFGPNSAVNLLFGGVDAGGAYQPETWYYIRGANLWLQPTVGTAPGARRDHELAWDSAADSTVMFGGRLSTGVVTNQTWVWDTGYYTSGTFESPTFDPGCPAPDWTDVWWNATTPSGTTVRFKLATSPNSGGPWTFLGPDGLPGTFYSSPGTPVNPLAHDGQQFFRWRAYLTSGDVKVTPVMQDFSVNYVCPLAPPQITSTNPANGATGVLQTAPIVVMFSEAMNRTTVTWAFSDASISFTSSWNPGSDTLTLSHSTPFRECTSFTAQITGGKDQNDNLDLVPGTVANPWSFTTVCVNPFVESTVPASGDINVPQTANIVVTFSEPMNTTTVAWTVSGGIGTAGSWDATESVLTLTHGVAFVQCTVYTVEITAGEDKVGLPLGGGPVPNPWSFTVVCPSPFIASTSPASGDTGVALNADIVVTFSKAMNITTVTWTISGGIVLTYTWAPGNQVLTLSHAALFAELTPYTVEITAGQDTNGNPLVPGPVPNPWSFTTAGVNPFIVTTNPAASAQNVPLTADVIVTFSEAMNPATVTATPTPFILFSANWNPSNTILTLTHTSPFVQCTQYSVNVTGRDTQALPLVAGPVPNPWSFTANCPLTGPANLQLVLASGDVVLYWDAVVGATGYNVYATSNRFAAFPGGWTVLGSPSGNSFIATGHGADALTHYYLVRGSNGVSEGPNSSMGAKVELSFGFSSTNTNIAWFSLPYNSGYARASDIAAALGPTNIDVVGKWDPARQSSIVYYYARGAWRGTDFFIGPGDGLYLGVKRAFTWVVLGTDRSAGLTFTLNGPPMGNTNWVSVPFTGVYNRASAIANELTSAKIVEVGLWNPTTQTVIRWYWTGTWTGTDFTISPGAGVYLIIASSFTWTPILITPAVP